MLTSWAKDEGYTDITFGYKGISYINWKDYKKVGKMNTPKEIKLEGGNSDEITTYIFLHELGHHQLRKDWEKFNIILPTVAHAEVKYCKEKVKKYRRRISYMVSSMEEEFKAWEEGYKLGVKLGIKIDDKKWHQYKSKCLMGYIRFFGGANK